MRHPKTTLAAILGTILAVTAAVPAPAAASGIQVDVRMASGGAWYGEETWVEFTPARSGWVAVYAAYSDGSLRRVFPTIDCGSHWVDSREVRLLPVSVPYGVRLVSVQAVASHRWFDPADCRLVSAPGPTHEAWRFSIAWASGSHPRTVVRSWGWGAPARHHPRKPPRVVRHGRQGRHGRPESCTVTHSANPPRWSEPEHGKKSKNTRHLSSTKSKNGTKRKSKHG